MPFDGSEQAERRCWQEQKCRAVVWALLAGEAYKGDTVMPGTRILADRLQQWLKTFLERGRY